MVVLDKQHQITNDDNVVDAGISKKRTNHSKTEFFLGFKNNIERMILWQVKEIFMKS